FPPFADWIAALPLHDIALNKRLIFLAGFGIAVLAAAGCEAVIREGKQRAMAAVSGITAAALALALGSQWEALSALELSPGFLRTRAIALLVPPLLAAAILVLRRPPAAACAAIALLLLAQRTREMGDFYPTLDAKIFYPPIPLFESLPKTNEPYRITGVGDIFHPNTSKMYQVEDVRGYQAMTFRPYVETYHLWSAVQPVWSNRVDDLSAPFLSFLNVRYAIANSESTAPDGWVKVAGQPGSQLFENRRAIPRAFVPRRVRHPYTAAQALGEMIGEKDFAERAWIYLPEGEGEDRPNGPGRVTVERRGLGGLFLRASMDQAGWVVISEAGWRGWRAYLDGRPAELRTANHAFLSVLVPRGEHTLRLLYLPRSFVIGRAITIASIALLAGFTLWNRAASRRRALRSGRW
ncbi:MAG TPA: YfhO family protein, partial [Thermoanaerobaculia bacterium]|nr:YfhO family protein [Thermoanaerobaculia bacterium]